MSNVKLHNKRFSTLLRIQSLYHHHHHKQQEEDALMRIMSCYAGMVVVVGCMYKQLLKG